MARRRRVGLTGIALLASLVVTSFVASGHTPPPVHHALLPSRFDLPAPGSTNPQSAWVSWMTLSTDYHFDCGSGCSTTYDAPVDDAVSNWNARSTTVLFSYNATHQADRRVHIIVGDYPNDEALGRMQPWVREDSPPYAYAPCNAFLASCVFDKFNAVVNDSTHVTPYANHGERRNTVAHELGHGIGLDEALYSCGNPNFDPDSIMDGDCSYLVPAWSVCGVNHAYYDPWWEYAGC